MKLKTIRENELFHGNYLSLKLLSGISTKKPFKQVICGYFGQTQNLGAII
jgi:hypothetical protein